MPPLKALKARSQKDYPYRLDYRTRWADNDMYHHLNNSVYNYLFDSICNAYLIQHCGLDPTRRHPQACRVVHSHVDYFASLAYPQVAQLALRVVRLGQSSVHYEMAVFVQADDPPDSKPILCAVGVFVHVFVDDATGRPSAQGMHPSLRAGLERIHTPLPGDDDDASKL